MEIKGPLPCSTQSDEDGGENGDFYDFSSMVNPLVPENIVDQVRETPDGDDYETARSAVARYLGVGESGVLLCNSVKEVLKRCIDAFRVSTLILPYGHSIPVDFKGSIIQESTDRILSINDGFDLILLGNPHNLTGKLCNKEKVGRLVETAEESGGLVIIDECHIELSDPGASFAELATTSSHLLVLRSPAESFRVPNLHIGIAVGRWSNINAMSIPPFPPEIIPDALRFAAEMLDREDEFLIDSRAYVAEERKRLFEGLKGLGLEPVDSDANFMLVDIKRSGLDSSTFCHRTLAYRIKFLDCGSHRSGDMVRISLGTKEADDYLLKSLSILMKAQKLKQQAVRGRSCEHYPCHFEGQDCTDCYCSRYPCLDNKKGFFTKSRIGIEIWSCVDCHDVHRR